METASLNREKKPKTHTQKDQMRCGRMLKELKNLTQKKRDRTLQENWNPHHKIPLYFATFFSVGYG
jgi:hypothetical protein